MMHGIRDKKTLLAARGAKERIEFLLPTGVRASLQRIAEEEHKSVSSLILEILARGDARLQIAPVHFVDLRRRLSA